MVSADFAAETKGPCLCWICSVEQVPIPFSSLPPPPRDRPLIRIGWFAAAIVATKSLDDDFDEVAGLEPVVALEAVQDPEALDPLIDQRHAGGEPSSTFSIQPELRYVTNDCGILTTSSRMACRRL